MMSRALRINRLNNLSNAQWLRLTSSVWRNGDDDYRTQNTLSSNHKPLSSVPFPTLINSNPQPPDELKRQHPATFAESDVRKLILFFTKKGETVLDPFLGSGSTSLACYQTSRNCIGIELFRTWVSLSKRRLMKACGRSVKKCKTTDLHDVSIDLRKGLHYELLCGDSRIRLNDVGRESIDFVMTSPPYWNILAKDGDHKVLRTRKKHGLPTNYGNSASNLGEVASYASFLIELRKVFLGCARVLRAGRYLCVIVADFRHGDKFYPFHSDLIEQVETCGLGLQGITVIAHNSKHLYPYGMPYAYVSNIHHSYALIFRKRDGHNAHHVEVMNEVSQETHTRSARRAYII